MSTQPEIHRKVHEDSPDRCQAVNTQGQCNNVKVAGCDFCMIHNGIHQHKKNEEVIKRNYRLTKFRMRAFEFADNPQVKSLREEVGITRMQLEMILEKCKDELDIMLHGERIGKLVSQVQNLVLACQKLEEKSGNMLDKTQLFVICESIVKIIGEHVTDSDALDVIASKIVDCLTKSIAINPLG